MALLVKPLHRRIVGELVRHKERGSRSAAVGVFPPLVEQLAVDVLDQLLCDRSVEGESDHHWDFFQLHAAIWPPGLSTCKGYFFFRRHLVPSDEQKHSGNRHVLGSQDGALVLNF